MKDTNSTKQTQIRVAFVSKIFTSISSLVFCLAKFRLVETYLVLKKTVIFLYGKALGPMLAFTIA